MANVMSLKKLRNNVSRNGFDLSKRNMFSAKVGELLPVYCKEVLPGDKFKINVKSFTRTMPVNTAAYTRIKEYYDWFFVPTNLLWNKFNTFITQMTDNSQHSMNVSSAEVVGEYHPYMYLSDLYTTYLEGMYTEERGGNSKCLNYFGYSRSYLSCKLLDYLGYGSMASNIDHGVDFSAAYADNPALNLFPLLAYQKIYSDYFRESQWEKNYAPSYNVDYLRGATPELPASGVLSAALAGNYTMFDLRYCNWNKDLFMGLKPNSQYGDAASVDLSSLIPNLSNPDNAVIQLGSGVSEGTVSASSYRLKAVSDSVDYPNWTLFPSSLNAITSSLGLTSTSLQSAFAILALRQAEALQRWKEITQSQQQDYKSQIEAHFNVSVSDAYSERCRYIDGFSDTIDINEVVNTNLNNGTTQNTADIAGKGIGVNDGYTSFSSDVHGYIMCIYHAVPLLDYSLTTGISRQNLKTNVVDYAIPELDKTGMVSVPRILMTNQIELNDGTLMGYAPRYYDYKTDIDEVHGSFRDRDSAWVAPIDDTYLLTYYNTSGLGIYEDYAFFKVNPSVLDPIFASQSSVDSSTDSDQLLVNCYFDVKAVRNLDYDGLPY